MAFTNSVKAMVLDALYGKKPLTMPDVLYIGLSTTPPNPDGTNFSEPSGNGYARVAVPNDTTWWYDATVANPAIKSNAIPILFNEATGPWGQVTHWGVFDAETGGNLLDWAPLTTPVTIDAGQQPQFREGDLQTRLQNG